VLPELHHLRVVEALIDQQIDVIGRRCGGGPDEREEQSDNDLPHGRAP
jgi:hypothetical protein